VFNSNFAEGSSDHVDRDQTPRTAAQDIRQSPPTLSPILDEFEDSDNEDDAALPADPSQPFSNLWSGTEEVSLLLEDSNPADSDRMESEGTQSSDSHTSSPPTRSLILKPESEYQDQSTALPKVKIVVRDAAYTTYRAMLYYVGNCSLFSQTQYSRYWQIYTDNIVFAPLSSSFLATPGEPNNFGTPVETLPSTPSEGCQIPGPKRVAIHDSAHSRAEWIRHWMQNNPGRPSPCSAKSIYRIADSKFRFYIPET